MLAQKLLHRPFFWLVSLFILVCLIGGVALTAVCGSDQVLVPGTSGYIATGEFAVQRTPPIKRSSVRAVEAQSKAIVLWGSGATNDDLHTGKLISPSFPAPIILSLFVSGWTNTGENKIVIDCLDKAEQVQLRAGDIGSRWKKLHWFLPLSWYGHPVQITAIDNNSKAYGWLGISSPLQSSFLNFVSRQISAISFVPFYILFFTLFLTPGFLLAAVIIQRQQSLKVFTIILAVAISSLLGYITFWVYFFNYIAGIVFSILVLLSTAIALILIFTRRPFFRWTVRSLKSVDTVFPILLMLVIGLMYLSVLYLIDAGNSLGSDVQVRFFPVSPPDNLLPYMFAERLYQGQDPRHLFRDWLSSDRPPLQAGITLIQRPIAPLRGGELELHYQLLATAVQTAWLPAMWAMSRKLRLSGWQIAIVLSFSTFSGFFLFNSVYVWPKLLAAGLLIFAFALLLSAVQEGRRPTSLETGLAGGSTALGLLAHGGVIFTLPAMALMLMRPRCFPGARQILIGCLMFGILLAPWSAYQKFYEPPGDRLLKWHLAGVIDVDPRPFSQAFKDSYQHLSFAQIMDNKWQNLKMLVDAPIEGIVGESAAKGEYETRNEEFLHLSRALGVLNVGWLIWLLSSFFKPLKARVDVKRIHLILNVVLLSLVVWVVVMFGPGTTIIHQGSYATVMLLFTGLAVLLTQLPRFVCYLLLAFQSVVFLNNWIITSSIGTGKVLIVAPNLLVLGLMIVFAAGTIWLFSRIARQSFEVDPEKSITTNSSLLVE